MVMADDQNSDFVVQRRGTEIDKRTAANSLSGQGKIAAQQIRRGTADKNPLPSVKVVNNSARTAFTAGTTGSKFQPGQVRRLERELKRGDGLSNKQWIQTVKNCF